MIDEMYDRMYQHGRAALNRDIDAAGHKLAKNIGDSLGVFHRLQWSAPWKRSAPPPRCG